MREGAPGGAMQDLLTGGKRAAETKSMREGIDRSVRNCLDRFYSLESDIESGSSSYGHFSYGFR